MVSTKMENVEETIWDIEAGSSVPSLYWQIHMPSFAFGNFLFCLNPELASLFRHKVFNFD